MYTFINTQFGYPPIEQVQPVPPAATPYVLPTAPGQIVQANDTVFGGGEFIFARASGAIRRYGLVTLLPVWDAAGRVFTINAAEVANTANLGQAVGVNASGSALTAGQYAWFQVAGTGPISATASVAAGVTFGITAAGQVGANTAGKQILGAMSVAPSTQTVVKTGVSASGDTIIYVNNTDGWFPGVALSGTNVGAGVITFIDPLGKFVINSVASTGAVNGNVTGTFTGHIVATYNRPFAQGAIT
jgi:hypothetical protein